MTITSLSLKFTKGLVGAAAIGCVFSLVSCASDEGPGFESTGGTVGAGGTGTGGALVGSGGAASGGQGSGGTFASSGGESSGGAASGGAIGAGGAASGGDTGSGGEPSGSGGGGFVLPTEDNSIAYTGCSMANNIGNGYKRVGGKVMWNSDNYQTGAMVVQNWTNPNSSSWQLFDQKANANGGKDKIKAIMVQICIFSSRATDQELHDMVNAARQHVNPDTHIFIVGQPQYNAGHQCTLAGTGGAEWTDMKAQELAEDPTINENLSYLGKFMLDASNGEVITSAGDNCHATNPKGEDALGEQAKEFFGG